MALPNAGEVWKAVTTSLNASEEGTDGWMYRVEEIITKDGVEYARIQMIGPPSQCGGFYRNVRRSYMDASANWTIQSAPIP